MVLAKSTSKAAPYEARLGTNLRGYTQQKVDHIKELTERGMTQAAIFKETGVPVRTQRDWKMKGLLGESAGWPDDRKWPGWTVDYLEGLDLPRFKRDAWEGNLAMIWTAEANSNHYVGWFFRALVDLARSRTMPDGSLDWSLAIAGLPVLAEWLDCPLCSELAVLIEKHRPWEGNLITRQRPRAAYQREARLPAAAVKQCILQAQSQLVMADISQSRLAPGPVLLAALAEHIPLFDRIPRGSPYRRFNLGGIILGILALPKGENHG